MADRTLADIEADMRERAHARMVATYGAEGAAGLNAHWRKVSAAAWARTQKWLYKPLEHEMPKLAQPVQAQSVWVFGNG